MDAEMYSIVGTTVLNTLVDALTVVFVLVWIGTATTLALRDDPMDRPSRVAQLYGYTVCLIALITILFTLPNLIETVFRLSDPLQPESQFGAPALSSFDAYKATYERNHFPGDDQPGSRVAPSDEELRRQYEALRADRISTNTFEGRRSLVSQLLMLGLAAALFYSHWRWLRRHAAAAGPPN